jgi:hypothetical protein
VRNRGYALARESLSTLGRLSSASTLACCGRPGTAWFLSSTSRCLAQLAAAMTSECSEAADFRVIIDPTANNGLRVISQVMADKPVTIWRERIGCRVGHLDEKDIARLNIGLAFVMGLAD